MRLILDRRGAICLFYDTIVRASRRCRSLRYDLDLDRFQSLGLAFGDGTLSVLCPAKSTIGLGIGPVINIILGGIGSFKLDLDSLQSL